MENKKPALAEFEDPYRCSLCREEITKEQHEHGMLLHVKVAPVWAIHPETGEKMGMIQREGPRNRYFHASPCAEMYANAKLVCEKCKGWIAKTQGGTLCICRCHPPTNDKLCRYHDTDLERAGGK